MKKINLLKAIVGVFLIYVILSWIIPTGYFYGGELVSEATEPVGLLDLIRYPLMTFSSSLFVLSALVLLAIGGFYSVLNKTGAYGKLVENVVSKFKGKESNFLILSMILFGILSSITGHTLVLFVIVPFFIAVIMSLGYKKMTAFLSTIGAILVGNIGSTYGFNVSGYIKYFLKVDMHTTILYRIILFVILIGALIYTVLKISKKELEVPKKVKKSTKKDKDAKEVKEDNKITIPLYDGKVDKKRSYGPLVGVTLFTFIFALVAMYNWSNGLGVEFFNNIYESIYSFEINGYAIFGNLIGSVDPIGYWSNYELIMLLILASLLIGWLYNLKLTEMVKAFTEGIKKMFKVALYLVLANMIFLMLNSSSGGANIFATIADFFFGITNKLNIVTMGLTGLVGGVLYNDFPYMINGLYSQLTALYNDLPLVGLILQTFHGFVSLVAPTSVLLVVGLTYLEIPYKEYLKNIWKYLLIAFVTILAIIILASVIM